MCHGRVILLLGSSSWGSGIRRRHCPASSSRRLERMPDQLAVELFGDVFDEGEGDADDGRGIQRWEDAEEFHRSGRAKKGGRGVSQGSHPQ